MQALMKVQDPVPALHFLLRLGVDQDSQGIMQPASPVLCAPPSQGACLGHEQSTCLWVSLAGRGREAG